MARPTARRRHTWLWVATSALVLAACGHGGESSILRPAAQLEQVRTVSGSVWVDADADGVRSPDEPAPQRPLRVLAADGFSTSADVFIDEDGSYSMTVVGGGDLLIEVVSDGGSDNFGFTTPRTLTWPDGDAGAATFDFGLDVSTVSGAVWVDLDGDLVRDLGEPPSVGAAVEFSRGANTAPGYENIGFTDDNGEFSIDLVGDSYFVSVIPPDGQAGMYIPRAVFAGDPVPWSPRTPIDLGPPDCPSAIFPRVDPGGPIVVDLVDSLDAAPGCLVSDRDAVDIALSEPLVDVGVRSDVSTVVTVTGDEFEVVLSPFDAAPLFGFDRSFEITLPDGIDVLGASVFSEWAVIRIDDTTVLIGQLIPGPRASDGSFEAVTVRFRADRVGPANIVIEALREIDRNGRPWTDIDPSNNTVTIAVDVLAALPTVS